MEKKTRDSSIQKCRNASLCIGFYFPMLKSRFSFTSRENGVDEKFSNITDVSLGETYRLNHHTSEFASKGSQNRFSRKTLSDV